jgi:tetratricopeptide (TPR) repeat protein
MLMFAPWRIGFPHRHQPVIDRRAGFRLSFPSMKVKCPVCSDGKPKRLCHRHGGREICSRCCADLRGADCGDCPHLTEAIRHQHGRKQTTGPPSGHFVAEVSDELDVEVDLALQSALRGDSSKAMAALERLRREHPLSHTVCFGIGAVHAISKDNVQALAWFDKALDIYPYHVESHFNKAVSHLKLREIAPMVRALRKVNEYATPNDPIARDARKLLADTEKMVLRNERMDFETFLENMEKFDAAFKLMEKLRWSDAARAFEDVLRTNPSHVPSHGNIALCYAHLGRRADALASFGRALELNPNYEPAIANRRLAEEMTEGGPPKDSHFMSVNSGA